MKAQRAVPILVLISFIMVGGCTSVWSLGIVTKSLGDPAALIKSGRAYQELGLARGKACRYFLIAVVPWGDSTFSAAVDNALAEKGGDALINVTVSSSLYGFIPIYNVFSFTCTTVTGIAIKFQ